MFTREDIEEIKRIPIPHEFTHADASKNTICPFHADGDPSLRYYPDSNICYCFAEQRAYDIIAIVSIFKGYNFISACKYLIQKYSLNIETIHQDPAVANFHQSMKTLCKWYNSKLLEKDYNFLMHQYGLEKKIIDNLLIGFSPDVLPPFDILSIEDRNITTLYQNNIPSYRNRFVFPYWHFGHIFYTIARKTKSTPESKFEIAKYKKQSVQGFAENIIYNQDILCKKNDYLLITEGITDCILAHLKDINCISPVTTKLKFADLKFLLPKFKKISNVYICNDTEENEEGFKGAVKTAKELFKRGINVRIIELPLDKNTKKIDLNDYLKVHTKEELFNLPQKTLMDILIKPNISIEKDLLPLFLAPGNIENYIDVLKSNFDKKINLTKLRKIIKNYSSQQSFDLQINELNFFQENKKCTKCDAKLQLDIIQEKNRNNYFAKCTNLSCRLSQTYISAVNHAQRLKISISEMGGYKILPLGIFVAYNRFWKHFIVRDGSSVFIELSDFFIKIKNKFFDENENFFLEIDIISNNRKRTKLIPGAATSDLKKFKSEISSAGEFVFDGDNKDLSYIWRFIYNLNSDVKDLQLTDIIGKHEEGWLFKNGFYNIILKKFLEEKNNISGRYKLNNDKAHNLYIIEEYNAKNIFHMLKSILSEDILYPALGFFIAGLFCDAIVAKYKTFPILFCYGEQSKGKSVLAELLCNLAGLHNNVAFNFNSTKKAIQRNAAYYSNLPIIIDEFDNESNQTQQLKAFFDREGYKRAKFDNTNLLLETIIRCFFIVTSNNKPIDSALFTRLIFLDFNNFKHTNFDKFLDVYSKRENFGKFLIDVVSNISETQLLLNIEKLVLKIHQEASLAKIKIDGRAALNAGKIFGALQLFLKSISCPLSERQLLKLCVEQIQSLNESMKEIDPLLEAIEIGQTIIALKPNEDNGFLYERENGYYFLFSNFYHLIIKFKPTFSIAKAELMRMFKKRYPPSDKTRVNWIDGVTKYTWYYRNNFQFPLQLGHYYLPESDIPEDFNTKEEKEATNDTIKM